MTNSAGQPTFVIAARPDAVNFEASKTAVIVVDMQNHFTSPGGTFYNSGVDVQPVMSLVPTISRVVGAAREAGIKVVYVRTHLPDQPLAASDERPFVGSTARWDAYLESSGGKPNPRAIEPPKDRPTWNSEIVDGLELRPEDIIVSKTTFSGFYNTDLHEILQGRDISNLVFTGCTTSICVETTLRDARVRGYDCLALSDCVAEPIGATFERTNHEASLHVMQTLLGWVTDSAAFLQALAPQQVAVEVAP